MSKLKVIIIVEDKKTTVYLDEREVDMIENEVEHMRDYQRQEGLEEDWNIESEISSIIRIFKRKAPQRSENYGRKICR